MQDGFRIFGNGKSSKTTIINITNSPQAWATPSLRGRTKENLTHLFGHYKKEESKYVDLPKICIFATATQKEIELNRNFKRINDEITQLIKELIGKSST